MERTGVLRARGVVVPGDAREDGVRRPGVDLWVKRKLIETDQLWHLNNSRCSPSSQGTEAEPAEACYLRAEGSMPAVRSGPGRMPRMCQTVVCSR
jgi:hypothetical protein